MRGTFANIRIKNEMLDGVEGGYTLGPDGQKTSIFDAAMAWKEKGTPLVIFAGIEYGAGSSPRLGGQGHRPPRRQGGHRRKLRAHPPLEPRRHGRHPLRVHRRHDPQVAGPQGRRDRLDPRPRRREAAPDRALHDHLRATAAANTIHLKCRIDTAVEIEYIENGGVLHYVLRDLAAA